MNLSRLRRELQLSERGERWLILLGSWIFGLFLTLMVAFNRGFAYLHYDFLNCPLYVTEICLFTLGVILIASPSLLRQLRSNKTRAIFCALVIILIGCALAKVFLLRHPLPIYALRQSVLGAYGAFALLSLAFLGELGHRQRLDISIFLATLYAAILLFFVEFLSIRLIPSIFDHFQGLGVFLWMGLVGLYLLAQRRVDLWQHPIFAVVFLFFSSMILLLGDRGVSLGYLASAAFLAGARRLWRFRREFLSSLFCAAVISAIMALQVKGLIPMAEDERNSWLSSWASWKSMSQSIATAYKTPVAAKTPSGPAPAPAPVVIPPAATPPAPARTSKSAEKPSKPAAPAPAPVVIPPAATPPAPARTSKRAEKPTKPRPVTANLRNHPASVVIMKPEVTSLPSPLLQNEINVGGMATIPTIYYLPKESRLILNSPYLNETFLSQHFSTKIHNALWRLELWRLASQAVLRYYPLTGFPLGTDVDFLAFGPANYQSQVDLHNSHLAILFRFGLTGFGIYVALLGFTFYSLHRAYHKNNDNIFLAYEAMILFILLLASFHVVLEGPYCGATFWGLLGASIAAIPNS